MSKRGRSWFTATWVLGTILVTASPSLAAIVPTAIATDDGNRGYSPAATSIFVAWESDSGRGIYVESRGTTSSVHVAGRAKAKA